MEGFHDESKVKRLTYKNVLGTDMQVSNVGMGAAAFGEILENLSPNSIPNFVHPQENFTMKGLSWMRL